MSVLCNSIKKIKNNLKNIWTKEKNDAIFAPQNATARFLNIEITEVWQSGRLQRS